MTLAEGLALILSSLSVVVTVIGWTVTHRRQKEILAWQVKADKAQLGLNNLLSKIDAYIRWVDEGHDIIMLSGMQDAQPLARRFIDWQLMYSKEIEDNDFGVYSFLYDGREYSGKELQECTYEFYGQISAVLEKRIRHEPIEFIEFYSAEGGGPHRSTKMNLKTRRTIHTIFCFLISFGETIQPLGVGCSGIEKLSCGNTKLISSK